LPKSKKTHIDDPKLRDIEAYTHDNAKRANNPPAGMAQYDRQEDKTKSYAFDPHLDPTLQWAGKTEGTSFAVPTSSIHIHESIKPHKIIRSVQTMGDGYENQQTDLFGDSPAERMRRKQNAIEFYQHGVDWTNRLIAGDSLVIMNSLLEKEGMGGQVQMVYIDPPYGIKYGSNFQPFVNKRDVKDKNDEDLTQEPEMITAFRDTWELGVHSYLSYLRNRLLLARELLAESGSVFVQISDENVHLVRCLCDEMFGKDNQIATICYKKPGQRSSNTLGILTDFIIWYCKDKRKVKYNQLYLEKSLNGLGGSHYNQVELKNGSIRTIKQEEILDPKQLPNGARVFETTALTSAGAQSGDGGFVFNEKTYYPPSHKHWSCSIEGLKNVAKAGRIVPTDKTVRYKRYFDDLSVMELDNRWNDVGLYGESIYVVQTGILSIQRCVLMTTDPGDLVLDITCGSGTTAYVAEQWGRRWITCDTSRVAITLAKKRLMTATYDYYKLSHPEQGVSGGFIYKTVPHVTLKSIANNEPPATEILYDQPEVDKKKIRISGPFTVEALPAPVVKPLDDLPAFDEDLGAKQTDWREELSATGILGRGGAKIEFSRVEPLSGAKYLQAEAETKEDMPRRAVICFAGETKPLDLRMVDIALDEATKQVPKPPLVIFAAFQFDPEAAKHIDEANWPGVQLLKVQMNTDLMTGDLKKKRSSNQSFWLVGQPDVELIEIKDGEDIGKHKVRVNGFDYYDVKKGEVKSGNESQIAMWMLDTNYDGMSIEPMQVFFPMGGKSDGWAKLAKTLRAEINQELIERYAGNESLPFVIQKDTLIAVKIVDDHGTESMKVIKV
jgi:adenine-specific DNA-methyltransferase